MRVLFFGCFLALCFSSLFAQTASPFPGRYELVGYLLQEDSLRLVRFVPDSVQRFADIFTFTASDSITHDFIVPEGMGVCGNGLLYLSAGHFRFKPQANTLLLTLEGGHLVQDQFLYKARYQLSPLDENTWLLVRKKVKKLALNTDGQPTFGSTAAPVQERTSSGAISGLY